jgi:uncharacterized protein (DUF2249 family)/hemerythrin-like domain-containing protein
MTTTESGAFEAMLAHHAALAEGVRRRVVALSSSVEVGDSYEPAVAELVAYVAEQVLPHALAEEHTIYQAASARDELAETVAAMVDEHRRLASLVERLATADAGPAATAEAEAIGSLFAAHVAKENEVLLPPLAADATADLAGLLAEMHRLTEAAQEETSPDEDLGAPDTESSLFALLLDAAGQLADAGQGDRACRLAAAAWAALRVPRPDLAVQLTAALHRLARLVTAEPVRFTPRSKDAASGLDGPLDGSLHVRAVAPAERHERIFATYEALQPGSAFVLVNDHDPKPLRYQFEAEHTGRFTWDYLESGRAHPKGPLAHLTSWAPYSACHWRATSRR